ncbi:hypothetical protein RB623_23085 [Mesorhizobium sp. LHD-90]|uniref:hypothetical protein n=1 Tax=Mesorhizobium sp. LHD-90 TaxID=3071414 RepID=UPI0027E021F9|nr:hypothetical protein [Mesorhizobium sp. LHD-90]MDQ6436946.1 hypothetical protein [Mesorhizobium sp. LHD-90]
MNLATANIQLLRAAIPLDDSMNATFSLCHADHSQNWRAEFVVAITTLRAVGHVLHKVDCKRYPEITRCVQGRFKRWKLGKGEDELFVHFIEDTRNLLLKTYEFPSDEATVFKTDSSGELSPSDPDLDLVVSGYFKGCSVIGLLQHSHKWWIRELTEIASYIHHEIPQDPLI